MEYLNNIFNHPKTSVAGILIGITTIAGVLSQQGITLGTAGNGTVVALIGGIAAALLGLLAKDPTAPSTVSSGAGSAQKLGALMLCSILLMGTMIGCTTLQLAQQIVNLTPALESAIATVDSTASLLLPADAAVFSVVAGGLDAAVAELDAQAKAYVANPSASGLAKIQTAVVTAQQTVNAALLKMSDIKNAASQAHIISAINGVGTIVTTILALVQGSSTKAQVARMAAQSPLKLAQVRQLMDRRQLAQMAERYGTTPDAFFAREAAAGF